jgi:glycosyltransferase involved in cell wall biosynthesis
MKIALFHSLPSGGAKRAVFETVRRLVSRHTVDIYSLSTANHQFCDLQPLVRQQNVVEFQPSPQFSSPLGRLNNLQRWRDLRRLELLDQQIAAEIDRHHYDLVFVHPSQWVQGPSILAYLHTPTVYYVHEPLRQFYEPGIPRSYDTRTWRKRIDKVDPSIPLYLRKLAALDQRNTQSATTVLTNSRFTASNVQQIYDRHATVAYFGVDTDAFHPIPAITKENFVLSVGELRPHKGYDFLIEALAQIMPAKRPALHIIGNATHPQEHDFLVNLARKLGVELTIEVMVDMETLIHRYNQAKLFVYAPVREPFGLVALEAMACATPVIGVAEGGVAETVVNDVTGALVPRDHRAFAQAVITLLDAPTRTLKYGQQARDYVLDQWTWDKTFVKLEHHLCEIAETKSH